MMRLNVSSRIDASIEDVLEYVASQAYLDEVCEGTDVVSRGEVLEHDRDGSQLKNAVRWVAPTRLPRILKRYEKKAPAEVSWVEETVWDLERGVATLNVMPDVPESWHDKYRSSGDIVVRSIGGGTEISQKLEFGLEFGLVGKALEKLLKKEVEALLQHRLDVLKTQFSRQRQ